ncbi:MAG: DNA-3-methyladenine glycosylase 2 family protein [candidate division Zixibacteria bacterium]|nr:DNA-3-methyladenine glycosylase 2 family protein [candidate division Zixibacteria bacterium]
MKKPRKTTTPTGAGQSRPWHAAERHLARTDKRLARVIRAIGPCDLTPSRGGFEFLARSIVFQQLSLKAAGTIFRRLKDLLGGRVTAKRMLELSPAQMRTAGISRQKATYLHDLAQKVISRELPITRLPRLSDERVRAAITSVNGLGAWSADMYLIFVLNRPNVLPTLDVGVRNGVELVYGTRPDAEQFAALQQLWAPYCSIACWYLWAEKNRRMSRTRQRQ